MMRGRPLAVRLAVLLAGVVIVVLVAGRRGRQPGGVPVAGGDAWAA